MIALSPSVPPGKHLLECSYTTRKPYPQTQHHDPLKWPLLVLYDRSEVCPQTGTEGDNEIINFDI